MAPALWSSCQPGGRSPSVCVSADGHGQFATAYKTLFGTLNSKADSLGQGSTVGETMVSKFHGFEKALWVSNIANFQYSCNGAPGR